MLTESGFYFGSFTKRLHIIFIFSALILFGFNLTFIKYPFVELCNNKQINKRVDIKTTSDSDGSQVRIEYETEENFMKRIAKRMRERYSSLRTACRKLGLRSNPYVEQTMMEAKKYKFLYCRVPKAGSSNMDRVFNQLINENDYPKLVKKVPFDLIKSASNDKKRDFKLMWKMTILTTMMLIRHYAEGNLIHRVEFLTKRTFSLEEITNFKTLIIVRDPFERIVSSYKAKILNKGNNPEGKLNEQWIGNQMLPLNVTFPQFVDHLLIHPGLYSTFEKHWALYVELCQPCHIRYDVIAHLETIEEDIRYLLSLVGAPRNVSFNHGSSSDGKSSTKLDVILKYFRTVDEKNLQELYNLYKPDFQLFGYTPSQNLQINTTT